MSITRTSLVSGPAKIVFGDAVMFSKEDFDVAIEKETMEVKTSAHGKVGERAIDVKAECSFTPEGRWTSTFIDAIWTPYANKVIGESIIGDTDKPLVMYGADGEVHTILAAGITKLPDVILSATKTLVGNITFNGVRKVGDYDWESADSLYTIGTGGAAGFVDSTFDPLNIKTQPYLGTWGAIGGFVGFDTEDGWTVSFDVQTAERKTDRHGLLDLRFVSIAVMAKCVPIGPTSAQILSALEVQGGRARGYDLGDNAADYVDELTIVGDDGTTYVTIPSASLKTAGYRFGPTVLRNREIGFVAARTFSAGAQQALFTLGAPA